MQKFFHSSIKSAKPVGGVMSLEVLDEHFVNAVGARRIAASVAHGAATTVQILPHDHGHLPKAGVRSRRTGWDHAVVEEFVVQGVGPTGRSVLVDRHRRVVREVCIVKHFEHVVSTHLKLFLFFWFSLKFDASAVNLEKYFLMLASIWPRILFLTL